MIICPRLCGADEIRLLNIYASSIYSESFGEVAIPPDILGRVYPARGKIRNDWCLGAFFAYVHLKCNGITGGKKHKALFIYIFERGYKWHIPFRFVIGEIKRPVIRVFLQSCKRRNAVFSGVIRGAGQKRVVEHTFEELNIARASLK